MPASLPPMMTNRMTDSYLEAGRSFDVQRHPRRLGQLGDVRGDLLQRLRAEPVVSEAASRLGLDDAGVTKRPKMVGHVGLPGTCLVDKMTGTQLFAGQQLHDPVTKRVGQYPQNIILN